MNNPIISKAKLNARYRYCPETGNLYHKTTPNGRIKVGDKVGYIDAKGYRRTAIDGKQYLNHRIIWFMLHGCWPRFQIDHINRIKDDNRIENLRQVTNSGNQRNQDLYSNNHSGVHGVHINRQSGSWCATIGDGKKKVSLGTFKEWWDAVCARKAAENEYGYHLTSFLRPPA